MRIEKRSFGLYKVNPLVSHAHLVLSVAIISQAPEEIVLTMSLELRIFQDKDYR